MNRSEFIKAMGLAGTGLCLGFSGQPRSRISLQGQVLSPLLVDMMGRAIKSARAWKAQKEVIRERWLDYLGVLEPNPSPPVLKTIKEDHPEGLIRQLVEYESEPGLSVQGYLIRPEHITGRLPGVVALHSTSLRLTYIAGLEEGKGHDYGYKLAKQGFVVFCPICYLFWNKGDTNHIEPQVDFFKSRHPRSKGMAKMLFDASRAVDVLLTLPETDPKKIGTMGHSLGAKEALYLAAFDERVKVAVSNEGGIGIDFSNWDAPWYLGHEIHTFGHAHHELLALAAPKPFLLIGGDSADGEISRPYIHAVMPVYDLYGKSGDLQLYNHGTGHDVTPEAEARTYAWLAEHLK
jgi:dienelactone hydrolase